MELNNIEIGARIRNRRKECHLTSEKLAEIVEISPEFLRNIECGNKGMSNTTLAKISNALFTTTDYLLFGTKQEETERSFLQLLHCIPEQRIPYVLFLLQELLNSPQEDSKHRG